MKYSCLIFFMLFSKSIMAQEYAANLIPQELTKTAGIVVRKENIEFVIYNPGKAKEKSLRVFTIMNKNGSDEAELSLNYDKFITINNLKATVFDKNGNKVRTISKSDFKDQSAISGGTMYQDDRVKLFNVAETDYPITIEFIYERDYNGLLYYPGWIPQYAFNIAVQQSSYKIEYPENLNVRFRESKDLTSTTTQKGGTSTRFYECKNLPAISYEIMSAGIGNITPWVKPAPSVFEYDGTKGDLSTWNSLGKWVNDISKDGYILPPDMVKKVHDLTDHLSSDKEKTKVLYHYLQEKTRYVSIQLGVGGFRPFPAINVAKSNYGDCKALSNYMKALLKEAGINSHLVVVYAGDENYSLKSDFSSIGQANHMILNVPLQKDTLWLECTSQISPFNYLGGFTADRLVMLVTENGGELKRTPVYKTKDNTQIRNAVVKIDETGNAKLNIKTNFSGEQFDYIFSQQFQEAKEQKDYIYESLELPSPDIVSYKYEQKDRDFPQLVQELNVSVSKLITAVGNNQFLTLNLLNKKTFVPEKYEARKTYFNLGMDYYDRDEIEYEIPSTLKVSYTPKDFELKSDFGTYKMQVKIDGQKIIYTREQTMFKNIYPPTKFNELVDFYKAIYKADKQKIVFTAN